MALLPTLPDTLTHLFCNGNQLTSLPTLPDSLMHLYCNGNAFPDRNMGESTKDYELRIAQWQANQARERTIVRNATWFEELVMAAWHPTRVQKWIDSGADIGDL